MVSTHTQGLSAREAGLKACTSCAALQEIGDESLCRRCGAAVYSRRNKSLQRVWAFLIVGVMAYFPANIYPIMLTRSFTGNTSDTILSGIFVLTHSGNYGVAIIIFLASICIPIAKFVIIAGLAVNLQFDWNKSRHMQHRLHVLTEFIGRWSMIDVFVVAVLAALIQLGVLISIVPGVGINAFAVSVVFTMLAASSLDPRLLWDHSNNE